MALPGLLTGMLLGLAVSIFQATTQINEMTLSFIPKIVGVVIVIVLTMPWMLNSMVDFATNVFNMIPDLLKNGFEIIRSVNIKRLIGLLFT